jgi:hypothetical protein
MNGLVRVVKKLRTLSWDWTKASMEKIASDLGLVDATTGSDRWIGYRSPDPGFPPADPDYPCDVMEHPYGFSFHGQDVAHFHVNLGAVDMGEVCLHDSDRYNDVYEQKSAQFRARFKEAVKQITTVVGKPVFHGGQDDAGIEDAHPIGWGNLLVAVWQLTNARLILVYGQEDKELPIVLNLFVCPPLTGMQRKSR